jgi:pimeloyl-ACP methyl ester carboxylesterase
MVSRGRFTAADGTELAAEHLAGDGPTIVLLHAGVADRRAWSEVAAELNAAGATAIAYDRRGFGETPGTESAFSHADDLLSLLSQASDEPAWLVGNSQGGRIAIDVALRTPERVAGLVLFAPAISGAPDTEDGDLDPATRQLSAELEEAEDLGDLDAVNELEARLWLDGPAGPVERVSGDVRALVLGMNAIALVSAQPEDGGQGEVDAWSRLEEIGAPATVVWGELDVPIVIEECRTLSDRLPNANEPVELPGVAHLPSLERPDLVSAVILTAVEKANPPS